MKKLWVLTSTLVFLAACNGDTDINIQTENDTTADEETESTEEVTAESVINETISRYGDVVSYEQKQIIEIAGEEEPLETTTSTLVDANRNVQFTVISPNGVETNHFYLANGESFTESNGDFQNLSVDITNTNATYGELLQTLTPFESADVTETADGYELTLTIDSYSDLSGFMDNEAIAQLDEGSESIEGQVVISFNADYVYVGLVAELEVEFEEDVQTIESTIDILNVDNIDFIVLPQGAPASLDDDDADSDEADESEETDPSEATDDSDDADD